ncbi:TetR/AcrR family transcriptional regulator [Leptospira biflexa]|uniref:TetR/AcrR family transcriptional regulator n=1 Tax=Leptospira biflexa TaxID=172 RepID=UPI001090DF09|nr:TetR/AcrR family transcriptional regulator [Leptospira biflexa]TGM47806.1 TetR/AcrR family transcriptional regulator [Leptospira biflexa]TGM49728.1 TetR/AcrR family transcriptional regulator [Leptospira biflexa]
MPQTLRSQTNTKGLKRIPKREETKQKIYRTALLLFQRDGYEETTMRKIAKETKVSLGLTYYHFQSKEDLVLEFYKGSQKELKRLCEAHFKTTKDFKTRYKFIITTQLDLFFSHKKFLQVLARHAGDPNDPLSPFSKESEGLREVAVGIIRQAMVSSNAKLREDLSKVLPDLLWMQQMGILFYWLTDASKSFQNTKLMIHDSLDLTFKLIKLSNFPLFKNVMGPIFRMVRLVKT